MREIRKQRQNRRVLALLAGYFLASAALPAHAMHIMEGFLPLSHCIIWGVLSIPFIVMGIKKMKEKTKNDSSTMLLMAMAGAYIFVLSALKIPSVTGSCSHPTGTGLAAIMFGPFVTSVLGLAVLLFQAILLAHGGLTTLGANTFSMAIFGPLIAWGIYRLMMKDEKAEDFEKNKTKRMVAVFLAAALGDLMTYVLTSVQLAIAFPDPAGGFGASFSKFASIFAVTQIPLAISEGILTMLIFSFIVEHNKKELQELEVLPQEA